MLHHLILAMNIPNLTSHLPTPQSCIHARQRGLAMLAAGLLALPLASRSADPESKMSALPEALKAAEKAVLDLRQPLTVVDASVYRDGFGVGTISFTLRDAAGTKLKGCMDGRLNSITRRSLFLYCDYPSDQTALQLPTGSPAETALLQALQTFLANLKEYQWRMSSVATSVEARRAAVAKAASEGPLTGDQALQIVLTSFQGVTGDYEKVVTQDKGDRITVTLVAPVPEGAPAAAKPAEKTYFVLKETREAFTLDTNLSPQ